MARPYAGYRAAQAADTDTLATRLRRTGRYQASRLPVVKATVTVGTGGTSKVVTVDATASYAPNGDEIDAAGCTIAYGPDAAQPTDAGLTGTNTFPTAGAKTVTVTVKTKKGYSASKVFDATTT